MVQSLASAAKASSSKRKKATKVSGDPAKPKSRIQRQNESKIIQAAIKQFSRHGFRGATLDEIASSAGLSKPNLLYYFKNKEELYHASLSHVLDTWLSPLLSLDPDTEPEIALSRYIETKMEMSRDYPEASRMYAMEMIEGAKVIKPILQTRLAEIAKSKTEILAKWTREGKLANLNGVHLLFSIWAITQHYADFEAQVKSQTGATLRNKEFFEEATNAVKKIIFHGVLR